MGATPPRMPYHYFVSYAHGRGFGNCDLYRETPIRNATDAHETAMAIEGNGRVSGVIVLNFVLLDD